MADSQPLKPVLQFPGYESEWKKRGIQSLLADGSITSHLDGNHGELYPRSNEFVTHGVPYVSANEIVDGRIAFENTKRLTPERAQQFRKGVARDGDILFAHNATVGPAAILETDLEYVILSTTVTYYRCDAAKLSPLFLYQSLNAEYFVRQYVRVMSQSTRNQVPITTQRKFHLFLPKIEEQNKIASFLGSVDEKIHLLEQKRKLLEQYKKGVMQKIFSQEIRFKDDDGNDFPAWEEKRLGEVFDFQKTNSFSRSCLNYQAGEYQNIHYGDIHTKFKSRFKGVEEQVPYVNTDENLLVDDAAICRAGDLVFADASEDYNDVGKAIEIIQPTESPLIAGLHTFLARPKEKGNIVLGFSAYLMQSTAVRKQIMRFAQGISVLGVSKTNLKKVVLGLPRDDEQKKIAAFLAAIDDKVDLVAQQITHMRDFKKGLLQQMFV